EIFQTLVRRVGQAFGLTHCSFVLTAPGEDKGRVVAVYENPAIRDLRVELERYPEIQEAIRTERPVIIHDVHDHPLFETIRKRWLQQEIEVNVQSAVALLLAALRSRGDRCGPVARHQRAARPAGRRPRAGRARRDDAARDPRARLRGALRRRRVRADPAGDRRAGRTPVRRAAAPAAAAPHLPRPGPRQGPGPDRGRRRVPALGGAAPRGPVYAGGGGAGPGEKIRAGPDWDSW